MDTTEVLAETLIRAATLLLFKKDDMVSKLIDSDNYKSNNQFINENRI